jgi:LysR family cys regulon transcriptional activator
LNLQRLRYLREIVRRDLNLTLAAKALHTSQPGVSRQILELEAELGIEIFVRKGRRLVALTEPGQRVLDIAERILFDLDNLRQVAADYEQEDSGTLVVATTHTQARYKLPPAIRDFRQRYPKVSVALRQGTPEQIVAAVRSGDADLGIATEALDRAEGLITVPCYEWTHVAVAALQHPLAKMDRPTLDQLAAFPLLTYDNAFAGRGAINRAFQARGLRPNVAISALDSDVIKTYVRLGMGVGIIANVAHDARLDRDLVARDCGHLFGIHVTRIAIAERKMPRGYVYALIELLSPNMDPAVLKGHLR